MKTNYTLTNYFNLKTVSRSIGALVILFMLSVEAKAQTVYAITSAANLISFEATTPATITSSTPVSGILAGHSLEGLDFRPATGQLYAFSYNTVNGESQVYRVKIGTGTLSAVGSPVTLASGMSSIGFDFNPMADRIRVTSATGQNYRLNPITGALVTPDGSLTYAAGDANAGATPNIRATAYTNSVINATSTTIYYYDFNLNILATSTMPNNGTMSTVGSSGITANSTNSVDLDILTNTSTGVNSGYFMAGDMATNSNFYTINLGTGTTTLLGPIGSNLNVIEMSVNTAAPPVSKLVYGISNGNLISFYSNAPATIINSVALSGLTTGLTLVGIDFRPATGQLFAIEYDAASGSGQLSTINLTTAALTPVGSTLALATNMTGIGFDFNPMVDRIRLTSKTGKNYRLNPITGTVAFTDGDLKYVPGDANAGATPAVQAVAYTNSFAGTTATTLYFYDINLNILANTSMPNMGDMNTVGSSGIVANTSADVDMDISSNKSAATNTAYLLASTNGTSSNFYNLNLSTGTVSNVGAIGSGLLVSEISVFIAPPAPAKNVYAIQGNNLINFISNNPGTISSTVPITGVTAGQTLVGLDFRPLNNQLYAMGYVALTGETQIYTITTSTGVAAPVGTAVMLAANMTGIGFDFNPTVDRIRVTSSNRKNYRLNPANGAIGATDADLTYMAGDANATAQPNVYGVAYTNSLSGATSTVIYFYDYNLDILATSTAPNDGVLTTVGRTGIVTNNSTAIDLDILTDAATMVNTAFLSADVSGTNSNFYLLNLNSGEASLLGTIGGTGMISEMAVSNIDPSLPVTITDFSVQKVGRSSKLTWVTKSELNNANFVIERSSNGVSFKPLSSTIPTKAINGNSNLALNYDYTDALPSRGINYYRLVQTDKDGVIKYSQVLQTQFDDVATVKLYPNPTRGLVNVTANIYGNTTLSIRVTDASGKAVRSYQYKASEGVFNNKIDLSGLQSGTYFITLADGKTFNYNQVIQKQ